MSWLRVTGTKPWSWRQGVGLDRSYAQGWAAVWFLVWWGRMSFVQQLSTLSPWKQHHHWMGIHSSFPASALWLWICPSPLIPRGGDYTAVPGVPLRRFHTGWAASGRACKFGVLSCYAVPDLGGGKVEGSNSSSSFFLAACASVVVEVVHGRKEGFCPRYTSFRVWLASVSSPVLPSRRINSFI